MDNDRLHGQRYWFEEVDHHADYLAGALDVSTANWTATTYGAASLLKRKLSVVTPTAIKPNTPITVVLWSTLKAASTTDELGDIMFQPSCFR